MKSRLLCDIGNTNFSFSDGRIIPADGFELSSWPEQVCFISVNPYWEEKLKENENWTNLREYVDFTHYYDSMGIDRVMCCEAVENGVIVDAGSAVTVDVMKAGQHQGGFIYPGLRAMEKCFKTISPRLEVSFNFELDLATMPKNTRDALSYGALVPLTEHIASLSKDIPLILTGGDAERLSFFLPQARIDQELVFRGMKKITEGIASC